MIHYKKIIDKIKEFLTRDTEGYDVVDFRIGAFIITAILFSVPFINYFYNNTIPEYPLGGKILIIIQIFSIAATYHITFFKKWANEIGNLYSLFFAIVIHTVVFLNGFNVRDSAFAMIITFAMMGMFKVKKYMLYYTFLSTLYLFVLIMISNKSPSVKYFLIITSFPLYGIGIYIFSLKLDAVDNAKESQKELTKREAWFRNIFDNTPVGIVLYNEDNQAFEYNKFIMELLGYNATELSEIGINSLVHPDDIIPYETFTEFKYDNIPHFYEQRIRTKAGKMLWVRIKIAKMTIDDRHFTITMFNDITVEKNIDIQLRESSQLLKSHNEALEEFSYVISHDLQEPLRMITSFSQIIQKKYIVNLNDRQANNDFAFVIDGAKRMSNLIKDMLEYSRWTSKSLPVEQVDTRKVLDETLQNLTYSLTASDAKILTDDLPIIYANRLMLGQIFQNLISNAIKYKHPKRIPYITIKIEKRPFDILISIQDNGSGFDEKYKERIFGIFQRLNPEKSSGTGMGLAICKRVIERQGGIIWAESVLNEGSTFYFTLPYKGNDASNAVQNTKKITSDTAT